jgi:hypothetical protein
MLLLPPLLVLFVSATTSGSTLYESDHHLCEFMKHTRLLHWKHQCNASSASSYCAHKDWIQQNSNASKHVVLSYGHNGFGNQLIQHSVALMLAESLGAKMYIEVRKYLYLIAHIRGH